MSDFANRKIHRALP